MGTDTLGRDVLLRCLLGGRTSISIGLLTVAISTAVSMLLGSAAILFAVSAIMLMVSDEPTNWDEREYTEGDLTISSGLHVNDITVGV